MDDGDLESCIGRLANFSLDMRAGRALFVGKAIVVAQHSEVDIRQPLYVQHTALVRPEAAEHDAEAAEFPRLADEVSRSGRLSIFAKERDDLPIRTRYGNVPIKLIGFAEHRAAEYRGP